MSGLLLICITPSIGEIHFARLGTNVGESVKDVSEFIGGEVLRVEVSAVDGLRMIGLALSGMLALVADGDM